MIFNFKDHDLILRNKIQSETGYYLRQIFKDPTTDPLSLVGTRLDLSTSYESNKKYNFSNVYDFYVRVADCFNDPQQSCIDITLIFHNRDINVSDKKICLRVADLKFDNEDIIAELFIRAINMYSKVIDDTFLE